MGEGVASKRSKSKTKPPATGQPARKAVNVETRWIVGGQNLEPYIQVVFLWDDGTEEEVARWSPEFARARALRLLRIAEAAEADAFLVSFLVDKAGMGIRATGNVLEEYREYRRARLPEIPEMPQ
jgi:hypothetical protein